MTATTSDRKLAAILSADIVGYTRLMAEDEQGTIRTLGTYREEIGVLVRHHRGRVVDFTGDNFLAEFPTALEAVQAAVEIQRVLKARNVDLPSDRKMEFRMGVHLGDVAVEGERIYGDGVNIAARLEGLAEPSGVCISATVHEQVRHRLEVSYEDLGQQEVKNIPDPVRVYRVRVEPAAPPVSADQKSRRLVPVIAIGLVLVVVAAVGIWLLRDEGAPGEGTAAAEALPERAEVDEQYTVPGFGGAPAIAVLPFDNLSGDPDQEYFADGIAEDLITRLSASRIFPVIARNSSFTYKGRSVNVKQVSRELRVRYLVEGSVRRESSRVRVSVQLIDATTGAHIWADRYDRKLEDIFLIQDEITTAVAAATGASLDMAEQQRVARRRLQDPTAYDLLMRGRWTYRQGFEESRAAERSTEARTFFESAIEIDPGFAPAYVWLAKTHLLDWFMSSRQPFQSLARAEEAAKKGVTLDPQLATAHMMLANVHQVRGQRDEMFAAVRRAIALDPSLATAYMSLGFFLAEGGEPDEAIGVLDKGMQLSPRDPELPEFFRAKSRACFAAEQYQEAVKWAKAGIREGAVSAYAWLDLAASQAYAGELEESRTALQEAEARYAQKLTVTEFRRVLSYVEPDFLERWLNGLRKAGLPE